MSNPFSPQHLPQYCHVFICLCLLSLVSTTSLAAHIAPETLYLDNHNTHSNLTSTMATSVATSISPANDLERNFNQELQWRILNLLAQQLFLETQHDRKKLSAPYKNLLPYITQTFSVDISFLNPEFFRVQIIDRNIGEKTQLTIPRL